MANRGGEYAMQLTAVNVADYIQEALDLPAYDRFKLMKLVYFAQAWHLAWTGRPIFSEPFEAWANGPVERNVYRESKFGELSGGENVTGEVAAIVDAVLEFYGRHDYERLVEISHEDEPWVEARHGVPDGERSTKELDPATLRDYYVHRALLGDGPAPVRPAAPTAARSEDVRDIAARSIERWRETLEILAGR